MTEQSLTVLLSICAFCFVTHCIHSYAVQKLYVTGKAFLVKKEEELSEGTREQVLRTSPFAYPKTERN